MEGKSRGVVSIDALISMILIISLIAWLQSLVSMQTDDVNSYGTRIQSEYIAMQYGSMIDNYYAANPTSGLKLKQPVVKEFTKNLKTEPVTQLNGNRFVIMGVGNPSYPIVSNQQVEISRFFQYE